MVETESVQKRKKSFVTSIVLFVFAGLWFVGAIGWFFIYAPVSENDTTEYTATISSITPVALYLIKTEEYAAELNLFWEEVVTDMDTLNSLAVGQTIVFRVKNSERDTLNSDGGVIEVVALKTNGKDIITLESFNEHSKTMRPQATLGFAVGGVIMLTLAVIFLLYHKRIIGKNK